jgi:hypothetical protein
VSPAVGFLFASPPSSSITQQRVPTLPIPTTFRARSMDLKRLRMPQPRQPVLRPGLVY